MNEATVPLCVENPLDSISSVAGTLLAETADTDWKDERCIGLGECFIRRRNCRG
jgi:hypothetical protein